MKEIVLTIDEELCAAVEAEAQSQGKTREMIIIEALKEWLQILEEESVISFIFYILTKSEFHGIFIIQIMTT